MDEHAGAPRRAATAEAENQATGQARARVGDGWWAGLAGVVSVAAGVGIAELVAAFSTSDSGPLAVVTGAVIDGAPDAMREWAISTFGTADKAMLGAAVLVVSAIGAAVAGVLEIRRPPLGRWVVGVVASASAVLAVTRTAATFWWLLPSLLGGAAAIGFLAGAIRRLRGWQAVRSVDAPTPVISSTTEAPTPGAPPAAVPAGLDRRRFLTFTAVLAGVAVVSAVGSRALSAAARAASAAREALRLPTAASPAPVVPTGAEVPVDGVAPYVTPNRAFYRIDTAFRVPQVDPATWQLTINGLVDRNITLTFDDLLDLPLVERYVTLTCVSNEVGGELLGNAKWLGYPVRELLAKAAPQAEADMVLSRSVDGWSASTPLEVLTDPERDCLLAIGMNGEPLPMDHGFPARLVVPGLYGYVSATKWVTTLEVTRFADDVAYWTQRGWAPRGPIKLSSRIDVPRNAGTVAGGDVMVAGVAWAQHTGIAGVEVQVDDGDWRVATLGDTVSADTWRQWWFVWDATRVEQGSHRLTVRATNADGQVQTSQVAPPAPDGASGWHQITVEVA